MKRLSGHVHIVFWRTRYFADSQIQKAMPHPYRGSQLSQQRW